MKIGIFGAGGFGREVLPEIRAANPNADIAFVVDIVTKEDNTINGINVISLEQAINQRRHLSLAVADWRTRERISGVMEENGVAHFDMFAKSAIIYDAVDISPGAILCANSMITSNVRIGKCFHSNIYSYVAHDCVIEDYVTFAPRVCCNGNVVVGRGAYIGTGAVLKQGSSASPLMIWAGAVIGMGAVVTKKVPAGCVVVGNPARPIDRS
ncbi:acetyltransferase [Streptomyces globisporus]|uniref:acetyltransferase n=1 Tax=Streptomyces globisporus TaxID=1908 RepID=UPI0036FD8EA5